MRLWNFDILKEKNGRSICKQWRPWSDAVFCGVWVSKEFKSLNIYGKYCIVFVLRFYSPVTPIGSCKVWSVYLTKLFLGMLSPITKTCLYNFDPLKPHFYIVKLGFTGVYIIFLISAQNIGCEYTLEPPRRGGSNEYPQSMFWAEIWKILEFFIWKLSFFFLVINFSVYLNRPVLVML